MHPLYCEPQINTEKHNCYQMRGTVDLLISAHRLNSARSDRNDLKNHQLINRHRLILPFDLYRVINQTQIKSLWMFECSYD